MARLRSPILRCAARTLAEKYAPLFPYIKKLVGGTAKAVKKLKSASESTAKLIEDFKKESLNMHSLLDNLKSFEGNTVDVYLRTTNDVPGKKSIGTNEFNFDLTNEEEGVVGVETKDYGKNTIIISIQNWNNEGKSQTDILRHETGHAAYNVGYTAQYYLLYLIRFSMLDENGRIKHGGHYNDPTSSIPPNLSGVAANNYEKSQNIPND